MNLLITGIHGFIGTNLIRQFKSNHIIYGLDIISPVKEGVVKTFLWNEIDQIPPVDIIIHLAGKAHDTKNSADSQIYFDVNTGLTKTIFDYFLQKDIKKFVFFSSVKAVADSVVGKELLENVHPAPKGPYGESKRMAEEYIMNKLNVGGDAWNLNGRSVYILRPSMIHGPGNKGNLNLLYSVVQKGIPWPLGAFNNTRSFTSVNNLIYILERMLQDEIASGIYNIADDEAVSTNELIKIISSALNKSTKIWNLPQALMWSIANLGTVLHLPLNKERMTKLTENYVVSNAKLKRELKISSLPISSRDGLFDTIVSFKSGNDL